MAWRSTRRRRCDVTARSRRSAVQQALQTEFPLQAEFDAFGTRVEGLALELARGLVAAKEETAESTKIALAERDAQIAERDARIAECCEV